MAPFYKLHMKRLYLLALFLLLSLVSFSQKIMIMGGEDHDVFLGYLNTSPLDPKSIWNEFGKYGNEFNSDCIWNGFGKYGNEFSRLSPWNDFSRSVPILIDYEGNYYGLFNSTNKNKLVQMICKLAPSIIDGKLELDDAYELLFGD
jgi:hypothetical protein